MSSYSLLNTIEGQKVEAGEANAYHTLRWTSIDHQVCPKRDMYDITGRGPLCADSLFTGTNGCVPVVQRINAENNNRPKYGEYISRVGEALSGDRYESRAERSQTNRAKYNRGLIGFANMSHAVRPTMSQTGNNMI